MAIYAFWHSILHLAGSFPKLSQLSDQELLDHAQLRDLFDSPPTYWDLLFKTSTGITGILLLIVTMTIAITSMR